MRGWVALLLIALLVLIVTATVVQLLQARSL